MQIQNLTGKSKYLIYPIIALIPLVIGLAVGEFGMNGGLIAVVLAIGLPISLASLLNVEFGVFAIVFYSFIMSFIGRLVNESIPVGSALDLLMIIVFIGTITNKKFRDPNIKMYLRHPIMIFFLLDFCYATFQVLNPNAFNLTGWTREIRFVVYKLIAMFVLLNFFTTKKRLTHFIVLVLSLATLGAIYGIYHQFFGIFSFEDQWLKAIPARFARLVLFGTMRIWSFFDGPTSFGLVTAYGAIFVFVLAFSGVFSLKKVIIFVIAGVLMLLGMIYSGTRTAFVIVPVGMALYFLMTLNRPRTLIISIAVMVIFGVIYFGPFNNPSISRLRSAFEGTNDPSMNVRVINRHRVQPYIFTHILGGGPGTTNDGGLATSPGHPLAGVQTDGYYLRVVLEKGLPGLLIVMGMILAVLSTGITNYYRCRDPILKSIIAAIVCSFFAICISNYTQEGTSLRPMDIIALCTYVLVIKIPLLDNKNIF